jgi:hypothetical protein
VHQIKGFLGRHPRIGMWIILAAGMVAILLWASKDVELLLRQRLALVIATIGLAGLCIWIIGWEEGTIPSASDDVSDAERPEVGG